MPPSSASSRKVKWGQKAILLNCSFQKRKEKKFLKALLGDENSIGIEDTGSRVHIPKVVSQFHYFLGETS